MFLFLGSLLWVCFLFFFVDDDSDPLLFPSVPSSALSLCGLLLQKELCMELCMEDPPKRIVTKQHIYFIYLFFQFKNANDAAGRGQHHST